jgi:hypothetical protein
MYIKSNCIRSEVFQNKFEKFKDVPFSFFYDCIPTIDELNINQINIFAHAEPNEYFGIHDWIFQNKDNFSLILTWNQKIVNKCDNARLLLYGEAWVDDGSGIIYENNDKQFELTFIRGKKLQSYGHYIRHQIFNRQSEIVIPHKFYAETDTSTDQKLKESKIMLHKNAMFSLVIENTSHHNYFSEKITDSMLMKSIPVYWGCSNIEKYYNTDGIIIIQNDDDFFEKINSLTPDYYNQRLEAVEENWNRAFEYKDYHERIYKILEETFILNKLI